MLLVILAGAALYGAFRELEPARRPTNGASGSPPPAADGNLQVVTGLLDDIYELCETSIRKHLGSQEQTRRAEIQEIIGGPLRHEPSEAERSANRNLVIAAGTFAAATLGRVFYRPLLVLSAPGIALRITKVLRTAHRDWTEDREIKQSVMLLVLDAGMLALGKIWTLTLFQVVYSAVDKLLIVAYEDSEAALQNVFGDLPRTAWTAVDGVEVEVPLGDVREGDCVIVEAGHLVPVDGTIVDGVVSVDQHTLTGEANPAEKRPGDSVYAGTFVFAGRATLRVDKAGDATVVAQIGKILTETADYRTGTQLLCEEIAAKSIIPTFAIGGVTLLVLGPTAAIASLTCAIGFQMQFTGPLCIQTYLRWMSAQGILVKDGRALERAVEVDTVVFDKTGTLTEERPTVRAVHVFGSLGAEDILRNAASAESRQAHPIAQAILKEASERSLEISPCTDVHCVVGHGVKATIGDSVVVVGSARFLQEEGLLLPEDVDPIRGSMEDVEGTLVFVAVGGTLVGAVELAGSVRSEAHEVVHALQEQGVEVWILSGDHEQPTRHLADSLGVDGYAAEVLPQQKGNALERFREKGRRVCFVGDGINDAIALKVAHVSVSIKGATTAALDAAHVILRKPDLRLVPRLLEGSRKFRDAMQRNFAASTVPGIVSIASIYVLKTGIMTSAVLAWVGLGLGTVNSVIPPASTSDDDQR